MHTVVGAFQAKTHFSALLLKVEKGEQVVITKHGHPVAKLIPVTPINTNIDKTITRLKKFSKKNTLGKVDWKVLRDDGENK